MKKHNLFRIFLFFAVFSAVLPVFGQTFSKYLSNTLPNTSFRMVRGLSNQTGYLLLCERVTTHRYTYVIRTDTGVAPVWTRRIDYAQAGAPFDNASFFDIGELPNGNYYLFGETTDIPQGAVWYLVFVLDTNGNVLHQTALREASHVANGCFVPRIQVTQDGNLLVAAGEYEWTGFYRLDTALNLLSTGFYQHSAGFDSRGGEVIMLADSNLLMGSELPAPFTLIKTDRQGNILWTKMYNGPGRIFSLYEATDKSIYAGGWTTRPYLAKMDSTGQLLWWRQYDTPPANNAGSAITRIFPMANGHLMLYCDSVTFEVDTLGMPAGIGYSQPKDNYGELRSIGSDFTYCASIYQPAATMYMPTIMRFPTPAASSCMQVRNLSVASPSWTTGVALISRKNDSIVQQSPPFEDTLISFTYDPIPSCQPNGIVESHAEETVTVFPNPANEEIRFQLPQHFSGRARVEILDCSGRVVFAEKLNGGEFRISTEGFAEGLYLLRISDEKEWTIAARFSVVH